MRNFLFLIVLVVAIGCKSDKKEQQEGTYVAPSENSTKKTTNKNGASSGEFNVAESRERGAEIYNNLCVVCHLNNGEGIPNLYPPLNKSNWLTEKRDASIHAVKYGLQGAIEVNGEQFNSIMTPLGLKDQEIADVLNYVFTAWDNEVTPPVTPDEVATIKE